MATPTWEARLRDLRGRLQSRWDEEMRNVLGPPRPRAERQPSPAASPENAARLAMLQTYPDEPEGLHALGVLRTLPPESVTMLRRYGDDEIRSLRRGEQPGLRGTRGGESHRQRLLDAGLLRPREGLADQYQLTESGRRAARLLVATGQPPAYLVGAEH